MSTHNTHGIVREETTKLLDIIQLKELYRFKDYLVHYRYGFVPKMECSIMELAWGFVKDPCFANDVAKNLEKILPDIRDEPPVFVKEWEALDEEREEREEREELEEGEIRVSYTIETETRTVESESHNDNEDDEDDEDEDEDDEDDEDEDDEDEDDVDDEDDKREDKREDKIEIIYRSFQNARTYDDFLKDWEEMNRKPEDIPHDLDERIERIFADYLTQKQELKREHSEIRDRLEQSIENLKDTAELCSPIPQKSSPIEIDVERERYDAAESMHRLSDVEEVEIKSPEPHFAKNVESPEMVYTTVKNDNILVRVFTAQDLKWGCGADLVNVKEVPHKAFTVKAGDTWGERVSFEVEIDGVDLETDWNKWTAFVFEKRNLYGENTIRPSRKIGDYEMMSVYANNLNVGNEVWILMLPIENFDENNQVVLHKKWYQKGWFYYQGFVVVDKNDVLSDTFKGKGALFEEVKAVDVNDVQVDSLQSYDDLRLSINDSELYTGDIVVYTKHGITSEDIKEVYETIEESKKSKTFVL